MPFRVGSVVDADSEWGRKGMEGYSSVGMPVEDSQPDDLTVEAVRGDDAIPPGTKVDFVKLDLQGGELNALKGMAGLLPEVLFMWVEYEGQPGLLDYLSDHGFAVFDTEYTFVREPSAEELAVFDVSEGDAVSTGHRTWKGFKREPTPSSETDFAENTADTYYVWTDLVCVNRARFDEFQRALHFL